MKIRVLGSAAGGGFPQWNCGCKNCFSVRNNVSGYRRRTQSSIAVCVDDKQWLLVNASPDLLAQIHNTPELWPEPNSRKTPLTAVLLTDAQIDHISGLLMLREGCPINLYCTNLVYDDLTFSLPILSALSHWKGGFTRHAFELDTSFKIEGITDLDITPIPLLSNAPPYSPRRDKPQDGDNIGLILKQKSTGFTVFYAPGLSHIDDNIKSCFQRADCVLVDGTFWHNKEMEKLGLSNKSALSMGHISLSGNDGLIQELDKYTDTRRILIHINNTNPILNENSPEHKYLKEHNIEVAYDGMLIESRLQSSTQATKRDSSPTGTRQELLHTTFS